MFVLKTDNRFEWPVDVEVPADGGKHTTQRFTAVFDTVPAEEMQKLLELPGFEQDRSITRRVLVGWGDDVKDEDGEPVPFTDEARDRLLAVPYVRVAVVLAYFNATSGRKAARKN